MSDMPDAGASHVHGKSGGNILTHKLGPLPVWGWFAIALVSYIIYRKLKGGSTAGNGTVTAANGANNLLGSQGAYTNGAGQIIDAATGQVLGTTTGSGIPTTTTTTPISGQDWAAKAYNALQGLGYSNQAINDALQKYVSGQPLNATEMGIVDGAVNLVGAAPSSIGSPISAPVVPTPAAPTPTPVVTNPTPASAPPPSNPLPSTGPPNLPAALVSAMQSNGEYLVSTVYDAPKNEWLYLTQKGGVYALNSKGDTSGTSFYGSLFSLPASVFAGRTAQTLTVEQNGGYIVTDTAGENYKFDAQNNYSSGTKTSAAA